MARPDPTSSLDQMLSNLGDEEPDDVLATEDDDLFPDDEDEQQDSDDGQDDAQEEQDTSEEAAEEEVDPAQQQAANNGPLSPVETVRLLKQYQTSLVPMLKRQVQARDEQLTAMKQQLEGMQQYHADMQSWQLSPADARVGLQMAAHYRANPAQLIGQLIADAKAKGVDLSQINIGGIDGQAVQRAINTALQQAGINPQQQSAPQQQRQTPQQIVDSFYTAVPEAFMHDQVLAELATKNPNAHPMQIWTELVRAAQQHGWDMSRPLVPQIAATRARLNNQQQQPANPNPSKPNFNSRRSAADPGANAPRRTEPIDPNMSYKDAVNQVRREMGL